MARVPRLEPTFEPADALIGIATNIPVIQLVHFINSKSFLKLVRKDDFPVYSEKTNTQIESKFFHGEDQDFRSTFSLFCNNNEGVNLLPSHKQFGYFLVVYGAITDEKIKQLISQIKSIPGVQLAAVIKQESIKLLEGILLDLELHLSAIKTEKTKKQKNFMDLSENQ